MTKAKLILQLAGQTNLTKAEAEKTLGALIDTIITTLQTDGRVSLPGFGIFSVSERPERTGRNPQTGAMIQIAAGKAVKFKPGKVLKEAVR
jgi:DNA-binding protein HU-beta